MVSILSPEPRPPRYSVVWNPKNSKGWSLQYRDGAQRVIEIYSDRGAALYRAIIDLPHGTVFSDTTILKCLTKTIRVTEPSEDVTYGPSLPGVRSSEETL